MIKPAGSLVESPVEFPELGVRAVDGRVALVAHALEPEELVLEVGQAEVKLEDGPLAARCTLR